MSRLVFGIEYLILRLAVKDFIQAGLIPLILLLLFSRLFGIMFALYPTNDRVGTSNFSSIISNDIHVMQVANDEVTISITTAFSLALRINRLRLNLCKSIVCHKSILLLLRKRSSALAIHIWSFIDYSDAILSRPTVNAKPDNALLVSVEQPVVENHAFKELFHCLVIVANLCFYYDTVFQILPHLALCTRR